MKKIMLPKWLEEELTIYAEKVLSNPDFYINTANEKRLRHCTYDQYDSSFPGVSDEFILNHDLNNIQWGGYTLDINACSNVKSISYPPMDISMKLINFISEETGYTFIQPSGNFLYPVGGYMGWHTNSNAVAYRVYAAYVTESDGSYFKYIDTTESNPEIITDWDKKGWNIRIFNIPSPSIGYLWHCVESPKTPRISFGYRFKE